MVFEGLSPEAIATASNPRLTVGHGVLESAFQELGSFAVATQPEPWALVEPALRARAAHTWLVNGMELESLAAVEATLPRVEAVVGLGGGASIDAAKYVAWRRNIPVMTIPTIVSVDAAVTNTIAVRQGGRVNYIGFVVPQHVVVELDIIRQAPPHLNRAGIGDILSIHTGSFDWRRATAAGFASYDAAIAARAKALVDSLYANAGAIRNVDDAALELLIRAYIANNALCIDAGTAQPEEGCEHFWAYHVEYLTGRTFVHGELVSLGVLVMSHLQQNEPGRVRELLEQTGIRFQPRDIGLSREEFARSLVDLPAYIAAEGHWYTTVNERPPDRAFVHRVAATLAF